MAIADTTMQVMHHAMAGLTRRGEVRADNIANAETPGYRAREVNFESALARAIDDGAVAGEVSPDISDRDTLPDALGNTVELETEYVEMLADEVRFDAVIAAYNAKVAMFRQAMGRSGA